MQATPPDRYEVTMGSSGLGARPAPLGAGAKIAILLAAVLAALAWLTPNLAIPFEWVDAANVLVSALFVALPVAILFCASRERWTLRASILGLALFALCSTGLTALTRSAAGPPGLFAALSSIATVGWAGCLGFAVASLFRDKNLLLPAAIVLATVDIIIVFAPAGTVKQALGSNVGRAVFEGIAFSIPTAGRAEPLAMIGPADFLFLGMFFLAIHRFQMNSKATVFAIVPALILYLWIAVFFGHVNLAGLPLRALPALLPIAIVVLLANRKEFRLTQSERKMTFVLGILCLAAISAVVYAASNRAPNQRPSGRSEIPTREAASSMLTGPSAAAPVSK